MVTIKSRDTQKQEEVQEEPVPDWLDVDKTLNEAFEEFVLDYNYKPADTNKVSRAARAIQEWYARELTDSGSFTNTGK